MREIMFPLVEAHGGKVVKEIGDGVMQVMMDHGRQHGGLLPMNLNSRLEASYGAYNFGGNTDSYYEYLLKNYLLTRD